MTTGKYDLIAFDVDGTLVDDTVFVWETLHDYFGTPRDSRDFAFHAYMDGRWTYPQWFNHDIKMLTEAGADRTSILRSLEGMRLSVGAIETLETLRAAGKRLIVLSGSLNIVIEKFDLQNYFEEIYLNRILFDDSGKISNWVPTPYDVYDKATGLKEVARRWGIPMERTAFVGDNFNDVAVAKVAGLSLAFQCKSDELAAAVHHVLPGNDLRAALPWLLSA